jgi:hypothetical protein
MVILELQYFSVKLREKIDVYPLSSDMRVHILSGPKIAQSPIN